MYTTMKSEKAKLKAYYSELTELYKDAILRRNFKQAQQTYDQRLKVWRALLNYQEWHVDGATVEAAGEAKFPIMATIARELPHLFGSD